MAATEGPILLVCDSCDGEPEISTVLKGVLGVDEVPPASQPYDGVSEYPWKIENKYYTADIRVHQLLSKSATVTADVADSPVEALLVTCNPSQETSWANAKKWADFAEERDLDIRLLLCDQVPSSSSSSASTTAVDREEGGAQAAALGKEAVLQWCIGNGFELVEMRPADEEEDESDGEEGGFGKELTGVERCVQVLNAHQWTNLIMKEQDSRMQRAARAEAAAATGAVANGGSERAVTLEDLEKLHGEKASQNRQNESRDAAVAAAAAPSEDPLANGESNGDSMAAGPDEQGDDDEFGKLFEKFGAMKEQAQSLDPTERKAYAEQVVMAFWEAMGGDGGELGDLDADSD